MYHTEKFFYYAWKNSEISKLEVIKLFDQIFAFFNWNQVKWHFLIVNMLFGYKHITFKPIWQIKFFAFYGIPLNEFLPQKIRSKWNRNWVDNQKYFCARNTCYDMSFKCYYYQHLKLSRIRAIRSSKVSLIFALAHCSKGGIKSSFLGSKV